MTTSNKKLLVVMPLLLVVYLIQSSCISLLQHMFAFLFFSVQLRCLPVQFFSSATMQLSFFPPEEDKNTAKPIGPLFTYPVNQ